ncbi:MAG: hypothetical protein Cons2KO_19600 [Congregibacter sp.]
MNFDQWINEGQPAVEELRIPGSAELGDVYEQLLTINTIVMDFETFMDGRGFSHARRLRELGYTGLIMAAGDVLPDQWQFLERCGFSGLEDTELQKQAASLARFSDGYQRDVKQPLPLFLRRG